MQEGDRVRCVDPGDKSDGRSEDGSSMFTVVSLVSNTDLAVAADNVQQVVLVFIRDQIVPSIQQQRRNKPRNNFPLEILNWT